MAKGKKLVDAMMKVKTPAQMKAEMAVDRAKAPEAPHTSRIDMSFKDVTKRTPELQEAAQRVAAGEMSAAEYDALVNQVKPVTPYNFVPTPATREEAISALTANKKEKYGAAKDWEAGTPVGLRLDIPAYSDHGVWVNSIHGPDSTAYGNVSAVTDARFGNFDDKALKVAQGAAKSPFAKIEGKWSPIEEEEAVRRASEYLQSPEWRQVGMDPERHGYFYDRKTMEPIVASEEVIQIGPLVLAKNPVYGDKGDFKFAHGGAVKMAEGGEPSQAELDRMRLELNTPVIQATPQSPIQRGIGTIGGYMDRAGQFVSKSLEPIAETHPVKHFLGELLLADTLKSAGTALQDYTKTGREITEDQPYRRAPITGKGQTMSLDPRMLDVVGLAQPAASLGIKGVRAGAKAATPFAKDVGEMASELYMSGKMPGMVAPNMYAVSPDGKPSKVLAPANETGFYSPTEAAALNLQRKSGAGQAFLNDIMKGENVKADEIKTMGLDTFLKDKKNVTADEVRDYIAQNKIQLGESVYGYRRPPEAKPESPEDFLRFENLGEEIDSARNFEAETKAPKFESYQLPGGENYREIVLTLPEKSSAYTLPPGASVEKTPSGKFRVTYKDGSTSLFMDENKLSQAFGGKNLTYQSSHWDEPNPLAHLRVSDRVTDGKKTLLVDEVQSDWHQAGREQGYKTKESDVAQKAYREYAGDLEKRYAAAVREEATSMYLPSDPIDIESFVRNNVNQKGLKDMARALGEEDKYNSLYYDYNLEKGQNRQGVPDAPYKDDWYQLTLRRAIKEAIDGGYDRVAVPTGARVADRFDLSKQVDRIDYNKNDDGTYSMSAIKDGRQVFSKEDLDENELSAIVGKDVAKKMVGDEGAAQYDADIADELGVGVVKSLTGLDLSVGGKGMKKYYDEIYPSYLKKFGKKYGANVGTTGVEIPPDSKADYKKLGKYQGALDYKNGQITWSEFLTRHPEAAKDFTEPLHYMDITPAMRKEFSTGIPMKRGGKVQFANNIDAMRLALSKG
jgi:hypothetical protein